MVVLLIAPCVFALTACGDKGTDPKLPVGTYLPAAIIAGEELLNYSLVIGSDDKITFNFDGETISSAYSLDKNVTNTETGIAFTLNNQSAVATLIDDHSKTIISNWAKDSGSAPGDSKSVATIKGQFFAPPQASQATITLFLKSADGWDASLAFNIQG